MKDKKSTAVQALLRGYFERYPREIARQLNSISSEQILKILKENTVSRAAEVYSLLNPEVSAPLIVLMDQAFFKKIFVFIDPALSAVLLSRLDSETANERLSHLPKTLAREIQSLMVYPDDSAGKLMDVRIPVFYLDETVEEALAKIRAIKDRRIINLCLVDEERNLVGTVSLQHLAGSSPEDMLNELMQEQSVSIQAMSPKEDVVRLFEEGKLISLPVVDFDGRLLGVIRNDALVSAAHEDAMEDVQAMFGAGRDEKALSPISFAISKRLPWLEINLATAFLAAAVVGLFEDTIARITALAIFLPVVAGQSGNTGSQALAVCMRGLALREIQTRHWLKVMRKEATVGFVNGCLVAITTALVAYIWMGSYGLSVVIAVAMVASMIIAGMSGAVIPIILKALGQDPAQSSSIILTTVTDVVGFLSFLGLATILAEVMNIG